MELVLVGFRLQREKPSSRMVMVSIQGLWFPDCLLRWRKLRETFGQECNFREPQKMYHLVIFDKSELVKCWKVYSLLQMAQRCQLRLEKFYSKSIHIFKTAIEISSPVFYC